MLPVGTIIYIFNAGLGAHGADNKIGRVTDEISIQGLLVSDRGFNVSIMNHRQGQYQVWRISNNSEYVTCPYNDSEIEFIEEWANSLRLINCLQNPVFMI